MFWIGFFSGIVFTVFVLLIWAHGFFDDLFKF